jgi:ferredoxin-type protein NapG
MAKEFSRRQLFRLGPRLVTEIHKEKYKQEEPAPLRPPGGLADDQKFLDTCERCHACHDACPYAVISIFKGAEHGQHELTPYMNPAEEPCRWCKSMDCIQVCPSGALRFNADMPAETPTDSYYQHVAPMAKAQLDQDACMISHGTLCDECNLFCPSHVKSILVIGRTVRLNEESCVGCGLCVAHCPATPRALSLAPLAGQGECRC